MTRRGRLGANRLAAHRSSGCGRGRRRGTERWPAATVARPAPAVRRPGAQGRIPLSARASAEGWVAAEMSASEVSASAAVSGCAAAVLSAAAAARTAGVPMGTVRATPGPAAAAGSAGLPAGIAGTAGLPAGTARGPPRGSAAAVAGWAAMDSASRGSGVPASASATSGSATSESVTSGSAASESAASESAAPGSSAPGQPVPGLAVLGLAVRGSPTPGAGGRDGTPWSAVRAQGRVTPSGVVAGVGMPWWRFPGLPATTARRMALRRAVSAAEGIAGEGVAAEPIGRQGVPSAAPAPTARSTTAPDRGWAAVAAAKVAAVPRTVPVPRAAAGWRARSAQVCVAVPAVPEPTVETRKPLCAWHCRFRNRALPTATDAATAVVRAGGDAAAARDAGRQVHRQREDGPRREAAPAATSVVGPTSVRGRVQATRLPGSTVRTVRAVRASTTARPRPRHRKQAAAQRLSARRTPLGGHPGSASAGRHRIRSKSVPMRCHRRSRPEPRRPARGHRGRRGRSRVEGLHPWARRQCRDARPRGGLPPRRRPAGRRKPLIRRRIRPHRRYSGRRQARRR